MTGIPVLDVAGSTQVGLGDYDGITHLPADRDDVSTCQRLFEARGCFEELGSHGCSERDLRLLGSDNALRARRDMESVTR